ncbi:RNA polymerase sigma factor [Paenibacillus methanolicus]|uniref:RNA polymerase sigma-70 factor (ECF subfamily) n=1 Tax=Paenibacillus methanolicus TaxID=582686 RepID=A0A5S5BY75_9BACL|nr:RNA polymerase sigma factor [Paenibacillus methanolicus]TYP71899.1 RNA polymerase sigma-70 factor (ECF subfamily) [Paenibacillus methanolicus]
MTALPQQVPSEEVSHHVYEALVTPYLNELHGYCCFLTRSAWDGEDLLQDTLCKFYRYSLRQPLIKDVKNLLFCIARNLWIDQFRRQKKQHAAMLIAPRPPISYVDTHYCEVTAVLEWLAERLPERHLSIWLLASYFGYSMSEIALEMKTTIPTVKAVLFRTRELIRGKRSVEIRKAIRPEVEYWSKAIIRECPQTIIRGRLTV